MVIQSKVIRQEDDPKDRDWFLRHRGVSWRQFLFTLGALSTALLSAGWAVVTSGDAETHRDAELHIGLGHPTHIQQTEFDRHTAMLVERFADIHEELVEMKTLLTVYTREHVNKTGTP